MNPNVEPPPALTPQPQPPQPHRPSTSCNRHAEENFTSFCPLCLCERLHVLESSSVAAPSSSRKPPVAFATSTATAALKAIFKPSGGGGNRPGFFPELRRTKSFSASKNEGFSGVSEPLRKSCDVRARNMLWSLFYHDAERNPHKKEAAGNGRSSVIVEVEPPNLGSFSSEVQGPIFESKEGQTDNETNHTDDIEIIEEEEEESNVAVTTASLIQEKVGDIVEEYEEELCQEEELKPMKDHIDLDSQTKKAPGRDLKEIAGSFWSAASVFSKKLQKWRQKQKLKKRRNDGGSARFPVKKPIRRQHRDTQSEIADYGFGRMSCDTEPRFSLDTGRMSFDAAMMSYDDSRYSFDEPRASWDGYLIGRTFPIMPTMVSVVEDAPAHHVLRSDTQVIVEDPVTMNSIIEDESLPGGSAQTRDYYSNSSSRRRKSLDGLSSIRKTAAAVVADMDEMKSVPNAKVSPASVDSFNGPKLVPDRDSNSNSLRDEYPETFESVNKDEDEDRFSRANDVERSNSESWPELRGGCNPKILRSNSSVSWRSSSSLGGPFVSERKSCVESNGHYKKRDEFVLERNRSARYLPNNIDNGLLRFYLTPMRGSRRCGSGKSSASHAHSIARSLLRLY
ncbi:auxin transporter-like protein 2-like [Hibiscus syriacus]|uniref:Auxin transporter-like protein 2-like n=1 Tax=Hibiscus syriacus TaxID=106335 RepID=A0A6A2X7C3_HIBSY|nr:auxin transporter-like protein 2-like [Hibiscus syriacus]